VRPSLNILAKDEIKVSPSPVAEPQIVVNQLPEPPANVFKNFSGGVEIGRRARLRLLFCRCRGVSSRHFISANTFKSRVKVKEVLVFVGRTGIPLRSTIVAQRSNERFHPMQRLSDWIGAKSTLSGFSRGNRQSVAVQLPKQSFCPGLRNFVYGVRHVFPNQSLVIVPLTGAIISEIASRLIVRTRAKHEIFASGNVC
jgi:hypothetical protein